MYLFRVHYNNFMSLEGQEYLVTEYPDEDSEINESMSQYDDARSKENY